MTLGLIAACAGGDTPARDDQLEQDIANKYAPGSQVASAGGAGGSTAAGGTGGATASPGTGGSEANPGTGGSTMVGEAGSGSVAAGAGGSSSSGGGCDGFAVIGAHCNGGSCHGAAQAGGLTNFALDEATAKSLAGDPDPSPLCSGGNILFNPDNPASSLVIQKMKGTATCGGQMPPGGPVIEDADIQCVQDWIKTL